MSEPKIVETAEEYRKEVEKAYGQVWDTKQLQEDFTVTSFAYGICIVVRKSDNKEGTLDFTHSPRFYHSFK